MTDELESHAEARVGRTLHGKYRLDALLGVGGMASVYRATHRNGLRVAVKLLHVHHALNGDLRARFLREGYAANRVDHRGAVRVLDDDTADDGSVFLVMELLEGQTLDTLWRQAKQRLSQDVVCELAGQLLDVLVNAHAKGVVHRDVKPENLFLTDEGVLKVLDFGIARLPESTGSGARTLTGCTIGTPAFMAPEQALGRARDIDAQSDLWGTAATMYTLLSGRSVHEGETVEEVLIRAATEPARSVLSVVPDLSPQVAEVIDRALAFDKQDRWPDAAAMQVALACAVGAPFGESLAIEPRPARVVGSVPPGPWSSSDRPPTAVSFAHARRRAPSSRISGERERGRSSAVLFVLALAAGAAGMYAATPSAARGWPWWSRIGWRVEPASTSVTATVTGTPAPTSASIRAPEPAHEPTPAPAPSSAPAPSRAPARALSHRRPSVWHKPAPTLAPAPAPAPTSAPPPSSPSSDPSNPYDPLVPDPSPPGV